ncbi:ATP-binding cassette transporter [Polyplosphaeria fusca]|uniref:ATP-binding cassette transporter n=1 Tax=Polyplosphaeria fusca TaxID=682080 RepID=A0A9P4QRG8_9PLEO|nr:ATP-binding cassette transporter [Polyplosphaeria fusca]
MATRTLSERDEDLPFDPEVAEAIRKIASRTYTRNSGISRTNSVAGSSNLARLDTLAGVSLGDPVLDPTRPEFDMYKWTRMFVKLIHDEGIATRQAGFTFRDLNVSGSGSALQLQKDVSDPLMLPFRLGEHFSLGKKPEKSILRDFEGTVAAGELLIVLGRPGSGCSTFLKAITGQTHGLHVNEGSSIHYNGITQEDMMKHFKGEVAYNQEVDKHFPHLTVWETLSFAAAARTPSRRVQDITRKHHIELITQVMMNLFGLMHTRDTKVGNDYVRGVSGGERKRVSIAEMAVAGSAIGAWDNSTRGLDSASALEFVNGLRIGAKAAGMCHAVAIYQASQAIYDVFDKAIVLYSGREIYFGPTNKARQYFIDMGWECPARQTTGDFLTSVTNPSERQPRAGYENKVPRTPDDFVAYWKSSKEYASLHKEMAASDADLSDGQALNEFQVTHREHQAKHTRPGSPYILSVPMQIRLCMKRSAQRTWNDKTATITSVVGQVIMALIIGSVFYGTPDDTSAFFAKGSVLFFAVLLNALMAITEINSLYSQRPIVEKQASYALYHPWVEGFAGIFTDMPVKFMAATCFNIILYFLAGLRTEPSQFFIFFLFNFLAQVCMTCIFRTIAALTKTVSTALSGAGVLVLVIVIYTGFTLPRTYMHPWFEWLSYINPVAYAFEAILVNEVHGRMFRCASVIPAYPDVTGDTFVCSVPGSVPGQAFVSGDAWVQSAYGYTYSHVWRNLGFIFAFTIFFLVTYLIGTEMNSSTTSTAEVLVFRRGHVPSYMNETKSSDSESKSGASLTQTEHEKQEDKIEVIPPQKDIFTWRDIDYEIPVKGGKRLLLDKVSGWVKPGTLTALMGVSGAGKTTLLDVLAQRVSFGVITGDMLVNGKPLDPSFQRKTGYVQQQDLHLETSTVREALRFSAMLRQPKSVSQREKYEYVEDVIKMLAMEDFAEAVVGQPGEGLNVEQRKLLTIGVELAAKPALLLFLDEPTSGLDSQSSWAIVSFLRKLTDSGQAVLATIHQPSSILFQSFDRLLFLAKGGRTVYFGDIGQNSRTLLDYFENNGSRNCGDDENPAEFMLEIAGAGSKGKATQDWHEVWKNSAEAREVQKELDRIHEAKKNEAVAGSDPEGLREFAMPLSSQLFFVQQRVFQQYWRTPSYIWGKLLLGILAALFIGFSFYKQNSSAQGMQNALFSIFMLTTIFSTLVQQIMPLFVSQRSLYEVRERPSKAYSWKAFLMANILVEIPWQVILGILSWASYYYPTYGAHQSSERQGLVLLFCIQFFVFASTFAHALIAGLPDAETAGSIATFLFSMTLIFNGVIQSPSNLPGFWVFMYRVSPLTYWVSGVAASANADREVNCANNELAVINPPSGQTCGQYLGPYAEQAGGRLFNSDATSQCQYCPLRNSDQFLSGLSISYDERWRNFGLVWVYIVFNIFIAIAFYYCFRVAGFKKLFDLSPLKKRVMRVLGKTGLLTEDDRKKNDHII